MTKVLSQLEDRSPIAPSHGDPVMHLRQGIYPPTVMRESCPCQTFTRASSRLSYPLDSGEGAVADKSIKSRKKYEIWRCRIEEFARAGQVLDVKALCEGAGVGVLPRNARDTRILSGPSLDWTTRLFFCDFDFQKCLGPPQGSSIPVFRPTSDSPKISSNRQQLDQHGGQEHDVVRPYLSQ
jgi:hypothetical protein